MKDFSNKVAVITGGASGFGKEFARIGADLGMKHGENCASAAPGASAGNTSAARTAYYHVNRVAEIARFYDTTNPWIRNPLTVNVNVSSSCNAIRSDSPSRSAAR